jgi:hypothetical protein
MLALSLTVGWAQLILISRNQEIEIGKEVAKELERQYGVWMTRNKVAEWSASGEVSSPSATAKTCPTPSKSSTSERN